MLEWLIVALREPAAQLVQLVGLALLAAAQQRIRGKQKRLRVELREVGVLPDNRLSGSSSNTPPPTL